MGSQQIMALLAAMVVCALLLSPGQAKPMSWQHTSVGETAGYRGISEQELNNNNMKVATEP